MRCRLYRRRGKSGERDRGSYFCRGGVVSRGCRVCLLGCGRGGLSTGGGGRLRVDFGREAPF